MKRWRKFLLVVSVIVIGMLVGCVSTQKQTTSGFLKNYPVFEKGPEDIDLRYLKEGVDFKKYDKIMMDEVVFYFMPGADYQGIQPSEIQELSDKFHLTFVEMFGDMLTDTPGPNVARMRLAVTDIKPSNPVTGTVSTVVPVGLAVNIVKRGATGEYTGIGSATAEVEFLDSISNERIAAAIDKAPGGKLDLGKLSPVEHAFKYWADRLFSFMFNQMANR